MPQGGALNVHSPEHNPEPAADMGAFIIGLVVLLAYAWSSCVGTKAIFCLFRPVDYCGLRFRCSRWGSLFVGTLRVSSSQVAANTEAATVCLHQGFRGLSLQVYGSIASV